ncbi:MAG: hypothetical protein IPK07_17530 [Deltaproteobacteria bacterium]|nr:hypothetical protein [Deltaproteobacteria bacterium]
METSEDMPRPQPATKRLGRFLRSDPRVWVAVVLALLVGLGVFAVLTESDPEMPVQYRGAW